jgi:hypothetical protein
MPALGFGFEFDTGVRGGPEPDDVTLEAYGPAATAARWDRLSPGCGRRLALAELRTVASDSCSGGRSGHFFGFGAGGLSALCPTIRRWRPTS